VKMHQKLCFVACHGFAFILSDSKLNEEEAKKKITEEDGDGDGSLSWPEYIKSSLGYSEADLEAFNKDSDKETALLMEKVR